MPKAASFLWIKSTNPQIMMVAEKAKQMYFLFKKLKFGFLNKCIIGNDLMIRSAINQLKNVRVT